ncbi:hypothetical protein [Aquimarina brevivitae]|uniref:Uncharacterized protein n=1 Tax=Aquimarina brevivitae TaxID=323412 RepID=A0A4Q7P1E4_9FLAO|nr:hypothetical protein [Aquimarina brevivitae]RZS92462.1 hypothetical protein EV197_2600 [Aquimarina brevivitae]
METIITYILYIHILAGTLSLITGAIAILSKKGRANHNKAGRIYFLAMTVVFITGIVIAGYRFNRFLFLIAFLSYYSVFSGVRFLKLKKLHKGQRPKWYDWTAGIVNGLANSIFILLGIYYLLARPGINSGALLSIGFGIGGLLISYTNLKQFIKTPKEPYHWYLAHIGNMMGGYIATFTAFLSTIVTRFELMNPFLAFALPSLIGIPLLLYYQNRIQINFKQN